MPWTSFAKDKFFAPKYSQLRECLAPDLAVTREESAKWMSGFVLTSVMRVTIPDPCRQLMFTFLRRVDSAIVEYCEGRESLAAFVSSGGEGGINQYSRALHAFESSIALTYQAHLLAKQFLDGKPSLFAKDDGSVLSRMDRVYNAGKHADTYIANGGRFAPDSTLAVWLVNDGIECSAGTLLFSELADSIGGLGGLGAKLASLEPAK